MQKPCRLTALSNTERPQLPFTINLQLTSGAAERHVFTAEDIRVVRQDGTIRLLLPSRETSLTAKFLNGGRSGEAQTYRRQRSGNEHDLDIRAAEHIGVRFKPSLFHEVFRILAKRCQIALENLPLCSQRRLDLRTIRPGLLNDARHLA